MRYKSQNIYIRKDWCPDLTEQELIGWIASEEVQNFIGNHENQEVASLLLSPPPLIRGNEKHIVDQILSRRKAKTKLPEWYERNGVVWPFPVSVEQSSGVKAANFKKQLLSGELLVDLTGGMGVDTLSLSENFKHTLYVEQEKWTANVFRHNSEHFGKNIEVKNTTAEEVIESFEGKASFYIDPARRGQGNKKLFRFSDCSPNIVELLPKLKQNGEVLIKASPMIDIQLAVKELKGVSEVYVVSLKNEVKEVLFKVGSKIQTDFRIIAIELEKPELSFSFTYEEERQTQVKLGDAQEFLFDPSVAILKAGAYKLAATRFDLTKLATSTHFYTSERAFENFPGRAFRVLEKNINRKAIKKWAPKGKINVIVKNYPSSAQKIKSDLKLKDGGDYFLIAYRDYQQKPIMLIAEPI